MTNTNEHLESAYNRLQTFLDEHDLGDTITKEEYDTLVSASEKLKHAADSINKRQNENQALELEKQSDEIKSSAELMKRYPTEQNDRFPYTPYEMVLQSQKWLSEKLD